MARLLEAGLTTIAEVGWHETSIDEITTRAGSSHGTFYLYFANKEDLLLTLAHECADVMVELVGELEAPSAGREGQDAVRAWLGRFLDAYGPYRGVVRAWMERQVDRPELAALGASTMGAFGSHFVAVMDAGDPADGGVDVTARAAALLALIERFTYIVATRGPMLGLDLDLDRDRARVLDTLAVLVHRGFLGSRHG